MKEVNFIIIGAGLAGLILKRYLNDDNVLIIDPKTSGS